MPLPFAAAAGLAAIVGATQDCRDDDDSISQHKSQKADKHQEEAEGDEIPISIRSIENVYPPSSRLPGSPTKRLGNQGTVLLRKTQAQQTNPERLAPVSGFVDGAFASGKIHDIVVNRCYTMAFSSCGLLAIGLDGSLDFYDIHTFALVFSVERKGMVSAIRWFEEGSNGSPLVAVAGLDGSVVLYAVDPAILEIQGPTVIYEFRVQGQVRALGCNLFGSTLLLSVGDKTGAVNLCSFSHDTLQHIGTKRVLHCKSAVLGLSASSANQPWLAVSTKSGQVFVHAMVLDHDGAVDLDDRKGETVWSTQRSGPVRCVVFSATGKQLVFGGYDKTAVLVDTMQWGVARELRLQGTVNTIELDPAERYIGIGCRDKTLTLFDTSTFVSIKTFHTPGWVTSISWGCVTGCENLLAVRGDAQCVSILDLTPIQKLRVTMSSRHGENSTVAWSSDRQYVGRNVGSAVVVAEPDDCFRDVASVDLHSQIQKISFRPTKESNRKIAAISEGGYVVILELLVQRASSTLQVAESIFVSPGLKALAWSNDGQFLVTGGKDYKIHFLLSDKRLAQKREPVDIGAKVWDIVFLPDDAPYSLAVALGDYTAVLLNDKYEPVLSIPRSRTARCLSLHPNLPVLAVGDGAGQLAVVDYLEEEVLFEMNVGERVNCLDFSPSGDFLIVGSDSSTFSIVETAGYVCVQEVSTEGFALSAKFSPDGRFAVLGAASQSFMVLRLGPFLGVDLVPLNLEGGVESLPRWVAREVIYRSDYGPSFVQRQMSKGGADNMRRVSNIFHKHPAAVYTINRETNEGCFETALMLRKPNLLKLCVTSLVNGTFDGAGTGNNMITTSIPMQGKNALLELIENHDPDLVGDIFSEITFMKVPFTSPGPTDLGGRLECGSPFFTNPWRELEGKNKTESHQTKGSSIRTPAVLPLPGLGEMDMLSSLLKNAPANIFDNDAMALVLRVMWKDHIRKYFFLDFAVFLALCSGWIAMVEVVTFSDSFSARDPSSSQGWIPILVIILNSAYALKEAIESRLCRRSSYHHSLWNVFDLAAIFCVYLYLIEVYVRGIEGEILVPLSVVASLLLAIKFLSYLRGFKDTGWLISVLIANFSDVRGFLIVLFSILAGFAISFRLLFGDIRDAEFDTLRRSFLSTFELTIIGSYDPALLYEAPNGALAVIVFILATTCVLVVALNALISILADSYARVQQNSIANRRREQAGLIIEYMSLLPPWKRRSIERDTQWFHTLLEVDADGDLLVEQNDWEGGLNALRKDFEHMSRANLESQQRAIEHLRSEFDSEIGRLRKEVVSMLEDIAEDIKKLRKNQAEGGLILSGKNVAKAVRAVKSVGMKGTDIFKPKDS